MAKTVTNSCTHLVSALTGTKKCDDAEAKGAKVVNEGWVRKKACGAATLEGGFLPDLEYVETLIDYCGEPEWDMDTKGAKIYNADTDPWMEDVYIVKSVKEDGRWDHTFVIKSVSDPNDEQTLSQDDIWDSRWTVIPPEEVKTAFSSRMEQNISEGVWQSQASAEMLTKVNELVDEYTNAEPVDLHPGTTVVRDLVHPSLYPLILSKTSNMDMKKPRPRHVRLADDILNFWNRPHEGSRFQWLPAEVSVNSSGEAKFTSAINNLDESKYPQLKVAMEEVLTALIPGMEKVRLEDVL